MDFPSSPLWDFSLSLYGTDGVPPACLRLQERHGIDVNFLFFCIWQGFTDGPVKPDILRERHDTIANWHQTVVRHLRSLRQRLKGPSGPIDSDLVQALRARIQKIEIDAEHIEQVTLSAEPASPSGFNRDVAAARRHAEANVTAYFEMLQTDLTAEDRRDIEFLLTAAGSVV